jgi:iron complex transport system ATP-binding protein
MLDASDITYNVGSRELISKVSASFAAGKLHLVIGPNGAGKSTLVKVLSRSLRPQQGVVSYGGVDIVSSSELDLAKSRAVLSQAVEVAFPLTVREVVMMGRYPHFRGQPAPVDHEIVQEMMQFFDVTEFADRDYQTLSGGERQRVNFARVLSQLWPAHENGSHEVGCRYLFLDEPLTFLDIRHQIDFMKKIKEFGSAADVVTVGVVHDLNLAARFADQIVIMNDGKLFASGPPAEVLTAENIDSVFGVQPTFLQAADGGNYIVFD